MISAWLKGLGFWSPGFDGLARWRSGEPRADDMIPRCSLVDSRAMRGTSLVTRMAIDCTVQAAAHAAFDLSTMGTVFGSAYGEMDIALEQLDMMLEGDGIVSPARFKNSVHNSAVGILSIATHNRGYATAIAAGNHTVPAALFEAMSALACGLVGEVVAVVADAPPRAPFRTASPKADFEPFGAAFALATTAEGAICRLTLVLSEDVGEGAPLTTQHAFRAHPSACAIPLIQHVLEGRAGTFVLSEPPSQSWSIRLEPR